MVSREMSRHRTLKKVIVLLARIYEISRQRHSVVHIKAFTGTTLKCALEAANSKGAWHTWDLLGVENPDESGQLTLMSPTEKLAIAALHEAKSILEKALGKKG